MRNRFYNLDRRGIEPRRFGGVDTPRLPDLPGLPRDLRELAPPSPVDLVNRIGRTAERNVEGIKTILKEIPDTVLDSLDILVRRK